MAAGTNMAPMKSVSGVVQIARVTLTGAATTELIAAAGAGKKIYLLGLIFSQAAAGNLSLLSAADAIIALNSVPAAGFAWPLTPGPIHREFVVWAVSDANEALQLTHAQNGNAIAIYVTD